MASIFSPKFHACKKPLETNDRLSWALFSDPPRSCDSDVSAALPENSLCTPSIGVIWEVAPKTFNQGEKHRSSAPILSFVFLCGFDCCDGVFVRVLCYDFSQFYGSYLWETSCVVKLFCYTLLAVVKPMSSQEWLSSPTWDSEFSSDMRQTISAYSWSWARELSFILGGLRLPGIFLLFEARSQTLVSVA